MAVTRISIAAPDIISFFDSQSYKIFTSKDINRILSEKRTEWRLTQSFRGTEFLDFLLQKGRLIEHVFEFPYNVDVRYTWGEEVSNFQLGLALRPASYLSHFTALYLHGLTEQIPKVIYVNKEQSPPRHRPTTINQVALDRAFKNSPRTAKRIAVHGEFRYCLLESMGMENEGIITLKGPFGEELRVTGIERTLLDCTVRPVYAGGVYEVLRAYKSAGTRLSVSKLVTLLKKQQYIYPYHQSIGFLLEKSGAFNEPQIERLRKFEQKNDFYLDYNMKEPDYSSNWRIYYPKGM